MKPDLRNVIAGGRTSLGPGRKFVVRHCAYPEIQAEGAAPHEAPLALLSNLRGSSSWATDAWHADDLARAIFDVEAFLRILNCSDNVMNFSGRFGTLVKKEDLIYYSPEQSIDNPMDPANPDDRPSEFVEARGDRPFPSSVLVYSVGRRRAAGVGPAMAKGRDRYATERRQADRRKSDRRQYNRFVLMAEIPKVPDEPASVEMERADVPTGAAT